MQDSQAPVLTVSILLKIDTLMHLYHDMNFVINPNLILDSEYKLVSILYMENEKKSTELPIYCKLVFRVDV